VKLSGVELVGYSEIADAHRRSYEDKAAWFQTICNERLRIDWSKGHIRINIRREHLLHDSIEAVMSLGRDDLRKIWRFEFLGEVGIDAGGLAREFYELVTSAIFDADTGLWLSNSTNQMAMRINPASEISCPEDHLIYFRFLGRVMGKALFDGHLVKGHMVRHLYKHILGWPITFDDLELADEEYYNSMKSLLEVENVEDMCLDFTFTEDAMGMNKVVDLISDGSNVNVTNDNLPEFMEANLKYHMMERVKPQMTELLLGFFDVIPEPLLTIFDFQELELLMCGLPTIDIDDWMKYTNYQGYFEAKGEKSKTCVWFWEIVRNELDQEMRARLLQFVTGTSGVPSRGFSVLQGNDGNIRQFTMNGVTKEYSLYPKSQ
jgi:E3 ubiquitin-protein ligase NEDD4